MNQKKNNNFKLDEFSDLDIVILCGGFGKRLRPIISDKPKILAKIENRTFIDILIENTLQYGSKNFILCVGYLKEQIIRHRFDCIDNCNIKYSEEEEPLGTGGALKNAIYLTNSNPWKSVV